MIEIEPPRPSQHNTHAHRHRHILREFQKKIMSGLTQSGGLSQRHIQMGVEGRHVTDDSKKSESTLNGAMPSIIAYAENMMALKNGKIRYEKTVSLYDCQTAFVRYGGLSPDPDNKKVSMKPDGGIIFGILDGKEFPLLIVEDKVQGTNDTLFEQDKKRQATGNAIERAGKNIRGCEMLCAGTNYFPYALFCSGCDFHSTETIAKRIVMMNYGQPNHYIEIGPTTTQPEINDQIKKVVSDINIKTKYGGKSVASVFVKSHKYNLMKHGASRWTASEISSICHRIIDQSVELLSKVT